MGEPRRERTPRMDWRPEDEANFAKFASASREALARKAKVDEEVQRQLQPLRDENSELRTQLEATKEQLEATRRRVKELEAWRDPLLLVLEEFETAGLIDSARAAYQRACSAGAPLYAGAYEGPGGWQSAYVGSGRQSDVVEPVHVHAAREGRCVHSTPLSCRAWVECQGAIVRACARAGRRPRCYEQALACGLRDALPGPAWSEVTGGLYALQGGLAKTLLLRCLALHEAADEGNQLRAVLNQAPPLPQSGCACM
jgi:hypothetical protein